MSVGMVLLGLGLGLISMLALGNLDKANIVRWFVSQRHFS